MESKEYLKQIGKTKVIDCTYNDKSVKMIGQLFPVGFDVIEKDLDRLEKLEEENKELKLRLNSLYGSKEDNNAKETNE